ncbi:hypothetical protein EI94DRAFT_1824992 [Lactarius quietus]|nr:hypothetical protein EI94DRAFT_1824992 [Lactarius quietus]
MRPRILLRRAGLSTKTSSVATRALLSYSGPARYPRNDPPTNLTKGTRVTRRASTSSTRPQDADSAPPPSGSDPPKEPASSNSKSDPDISSQALQVPAEQSFFWAHQSLPEPEPSALPPPEVFEEILNNVYLALHPQAQHKATYSTSSGPPVEPTLALYCPIEGGNYVIDDTVRELARRTGSDVVVLDAVHIAAGECGHFGQAASQVELPQNPLHFPSQTPAPPQHSNASHEDDDDEDTFFPPSNMTLQIVVPPQISRMSGGAPSKNVMAKAKTFFGTCINLQAPADAGSSNCTRRPRLIYIRDFQTLSSSWSSLHPALLSAVRQRRQGALSGPTSPVVNPTAIVFGITPPIFSPTSTPSSRPGPHSMMTMLASRSGHTAPGVATPRHEKSDWGEEDNAEKAREWRLRDRLRKWERGDQALQSEIPKLLVTTPVEDESSPGHSNFVLVGGPGGANPGGANPFASLLGPLLGGGLRPGPPPETPNSNSSIHSGFLRTSVLVPASRSLLREKNSRVGRRREVNELTMRMAIGTIGGLLEARSATSNPPNGSKMWDDWGNKITAWALVKQIADQAVGRVVSSSQHSGEMIKPSLSVASVLWDHVCGAWTDRRASRDLRKAWVQQSADRSAGGDQHEKAWDNEKEVQVDDIVEAVKHDPYLDAHEHRLVGCIVDSVSMPTSFAQVHLPVHTIDSVRTIVSLPLLHPTAFQQGILKEHSMTGCLLFGPPGTGKTLVVRALAKEAGCRMLAISPSDVMDMYVGEGEKLVRSVFSLARRLAPCVVFIDEIDALFGARSSSRDTGGSFVHRGVITEFMQEMDGLKTSNADNVIVIGATNRPFDLDDAVLRRLPRRLLIDLPGEREREGSLLATHLLSHSDQTLEILKILLRDETLSPDVDLKALARDTPTFSGSDLKHVCVSAALDAVKEKVSVPWVVERGKNDLQDTLQTSNGEEEDTPQTSGDDAATPRVLRPHNFAKALKEITPSASESLGSLTDLRKWNDEFGEGRKRKKQVWGKDRFGFTKQWHSGEDGRVVTSPTGSDQSSTPTAG